MGNQKLKQHILKAAAPCRAVAFDVFDTLIKRDCGYPTDLFSLMETQNIASPGFASRRVQAEKEVRAAPRPDRKEVTLSEIYAHPLLAKDDFESEFAAEQAIAVPNRVLLETARACHNRGQKIYAVSDMYLPASQIRSMLIRCGYDFLDGIFVSSEYGVQKRSGELFRVFLKETNLSSREVLFVGDDARADFAGAALAGIRCLLLPKEKDRSRTNQPVEDALDSFVQNRAELFPDNERRGFSLLGPLITAFAVWLHEERQKIPGARLVFLARDMYFVRQAYGILYPEESTEYLCVSRQSLLPALLGQSTEGTVTELLADAFPRQMMSGEEVQRYLGLPACTQTANDEQYDFRSRPLENKARELLQKLISLAKTPEGKDIQEQGDLVYSYLDGFKLDRGPVILVDIGSGGTIQRILEQLTGANFEGRFLACDKRLHKNLPAHRTKAFLFDGAPADLWYWTGQPMLELFISEPCGPTIGYCQQNGSVQPVRGIFENTGRKEIKSIQKGMMTFPKMWNESFLRGLNIPPQRACAAFLEMVRAPRMEDAKALGGFQVEDGGTWTLAEPRSAVFYICHPKALKKDLMESRWKIAFLKQLVRLPLPYDRLYAATKNRKDQ